MKKKRKSVLFTIMAMIIVCLSIIAPYQLQTYHDNQILGKVYLQDKPLTIKEELPAMSIIDKLSLMTSAEMTGVSFGKNYTDTEIITKSIEEINTLYEKDVITYNYRGTKWDTITANAELVWNQYNDNPKLAMIIWQIIFQSNTAIIVCSIDDETGKILGFGISEMYRRQSDLKTDQIKAFTDYLGVELNEDNMIRFPKNTEENTMEYSASNDFWGKEDYIMDEIQCEITDEDAAVYYRVICTERGIYFNPGSF